MVAISMPTPPAEESQRPHAPRSTARKTASSSKSAKSSVASPTSHRYTPTAAKRGLTTPHLIAHGHDHERHKRVWKACERCRMKKTKCDGEFPCKRCKDDSLVCTAGVRKKTEFKQLPRGYAEVLESTQFALIATIHKLYAMVRTGQSWDRGEPEINDRGLPVVHNIASLLGCIRPNSDLDLPVHSVFPENEAAMAELAHQLEAQQSRTDHGPTPLHQGDASAASQTDDSDSADSPMSGCQAQTRDAPPQSSRSSPHLRSPSSDLDHSDFEHDAFPSSTTTPALATSNGPFNAALAMSPQSLGPYSTDFETAVSATTPMFPPASFSNRYLAALIAQQQQSSAQLLSQGLLESEFGQLKPHTMSCPNPEVMLGSGDPMIFAGYDDDNDTMRLF